MSVKSRPRRSSAAVGVPVALPFADYLAECMPPTDGWASNPGALRIRAVLYVRANGLADAQSPFAVAERIAATYLADE